MRIIRDITENEMVAIFLKGEISSERFGERMAGHLEEIQADRKIIGNPDFLSESENSQRKALLAKHRGYKSNEGLFTRFPETVDWKEALLTKEELENVKYISYSYWLELSSGTRSPKVAAENVKNGLKVFSKSSKNFFAVAEYIKGGGKFEPIILVAKDPKSYLVVLEGHLRLTSYFLVPEYIQEETKCIIGFSPDFSNWGLY